MKREPVCPKCGTEKKVMQKGVLRCIPCTREWNRLYYQKSERRRESQRRRTIERKYGVSIDFLRELFERQGERCAICGRTWTQCPARTNTGKSLFFLQRLYVDHCHKTGRIRGLLCNNCNVGIAMLDEDLERFDAAKRYLTAA
jgi:hypothetical protein